MRLRPISGLKAGFWRYQRRTLPRFVALRIHEFEFSIRKTRQSIDVLPIDRFKDTVPVLPSAGIGDLRTDGDRLFTQFLDPLGIGF